MNAVEEVVLMVMVGHGIRIDGAVMAIVVMLVQIMIVMAYWLSKAATRMLRWCPAKGL